MDQNIDVELTDIRIEENKKKSLKLNENSEIIEIQEKESEKKFRKKRKYKNEAKKIFEKPREILRLKVYFKIRGESFYLQVFNGKKISFFRRSETRPVENTILFKNIAAINILSKFPKKGVKYYGVKISVINKKRTSFNHFDFVLDEPQQSGSMDTLQQSEEKLVTLLQQFVFFNNYDLQLIKSLSPINHSNRRILFFINPFAGRKKSKKIWSKIIKPMIDICHLSYNSITTEKRGFAEEYCKTFDFSKYNEIGIVGGDGTLFEVYQGLMRHKNVNYKEAMKIPISIFPGGTGNALATVCGAAQKVANSVLACARGKYTKLDISSCFSKNNRQYFFLFCCFAGVADANSMYSRSLGELAFVLGALTVIYKRKYYKFDMKFVLESESNEETVFKIKNEQEFFSVWKEKIQFDMSKRKEILGVPFAKYFMPKQLKEVAPALADELLSVKTSKKEEEFIKSHKMLSYEDELIVSLFSNLAKMSNNMWSTPCQTMDSGSIDFWSCSEKLKMMEFVKYLSWMMEKDSKKYVYGSAWKGYRLKCAYLRPLSKTKAFNIDGEQNEYLPVLVEVHQGLGRVMTL